MMLKLESQKGVCNIIVCGLPAPRGPPTPPPPTDPPCTKLHDSAQTLHFGGHRDTPPGVPGGVPRGGYRDPLLFNLPHEKYPRRDSLIKIFRLCLLVFQLQHLSTVPVDIPVPDVRCDNARMQLLSTSPFNNLLDELGTTQEIRKNRKRKTQKS